MILIDTHIWLWWVSQPKRLSEEQAALLEANESNLIGVSAISCWEIAKLVQINRIDLQRPTSEWFSLALGYPGVNLLPLTPHIAAVSTELPDNFRSDPADELLVATARVFDCPLLTQDLKIRGYAHVKTI